ncbi:hypothetical protein NDN08_002406 [Rhodosorus marinus]|uniref:SET domain-containing protein n=1 Tax=Rhodosorus marinus TaxID=101924 RepID=A0AAV8UXR1_9RHOD|nr:hypothetical protein NDN08_002406 [Rhodosorus marinus]
MKTLDVLTEWCDSHGFCLNPKVEIVVLPGLHARGMIAKESISRGEILFRVPKEWRIVGDRSISNDLTAIERTGVALKIEMLKGDSSKFVPYLRFLDEIHWNTLNATILWTPEELDQLRGCSIELSPTRQEAEKRFKEIVNPILRSKGLDMSFEEWLHLLCIVQAYSFSSGEYNDDSVAMTPLADVLNASVTLNNARVFYDDEETFESGPDHLTMEAVKDIDIGEEVYNTFGNLANARLVQLYGYIESPYFDLPVNRYDEISLPGKFISQSVERLIKNCPVSFRVDNRNLSRRELLEQFCGYDLKSDYFFPFSFRKSGYIGLCALLALLRGATLSAQVIQSQVDKSDVDAQVETLQAFFEALDSASLEESVLDELDVIVEKVLGQYRTSLEEDLKVIEGEGSGELAVRRKIAIALRIREKQLLQQVKSVARKLEEFPEFTSEDSSEESDDGDCSDSGVGGGIEVEEDDHEILERARKKAKT